MINSIVGGCSEQLCLAGLCHSIYGAESYVQQTVSLENRNFINSWIGEEWEELVYYFGAHMMNHFWINLEKKVRNQVSF
jgi:hypothetical protein